MILIKRYSSRKLYNTVSCKYLNLHEIFHIYVSGETIEAVDSTSDQKITSEIIISSILYAIEKGSAQEKTLARSFLDKMASVK